MVRRLDVLENDCYLEEPEDVACVVFSVNRVMTLMLTVLYKSSRRRRPWFIEVNHLVLKQGMESHGPWSFAIQTWFD